MAPGLKVSHSMRNRSCLNRHSLIFALAALSLELASCSNARMKFYPYSNASQASDAGAGGAAAAAGITDAASVAKACSSVDPALLKHQSIPIHFGQPASGCAWGLDGNLGLRNEYFQARTEQPVDVVLAPKSVICDLQFHFANQPYYYDDQFLLTFNGVVMAASYDFGSLFSVNDSLQEYDWTKMVGRPWNSAHEGTYCAGLNQGLAQCSFPVTSTTGVISLDYAPELISQVSARSLGRATHELKWITTGDNDDAVDCRHEPVDLDLEVTYFEIP